MGARLGASKALLETMRQKQTLRANAKKNVSKHFKNKTMITTLRLILGDQLNAQHSWFRDKDDKTLYLIAELRQETDYVKHHVQKLCAFFQAMQRFATALSDANHKVLYLDLDASQKYNDLNHLITSICREEGVKKFEYQRPDEYRLLQQMESLEIENVEISQVDTEHFLLPFDEISNYFSAGKSTRMEVFYRKMRQRFNIMMNGDKPWGEQWNYDADNRNKLKADDLKDIPKPLVFNNDITTIKQRLDQHKVSYFGKVDDTIAWPTTRTQALELLEFFCVNCLPKFGTFQDAMTHKSPHAWSLYHSRLSFALNAKMISPKAVVERAILEYQHRKDEISLAQIEGFVRQIIGWREFIRGIYWVNMPNYSATNALDAQRQLPDFFWSGDTKMNCMKSAIKQSLDHAYAHHIQRLMVTGNFCLLTGIEPQQVDDWYLGIYIDAIEWVEMPNTRGMCQFADGGIVASKPYTASGSYINRMSDYCRDCHYKVKERVGEQACPFNSLYWHFMHRHRERFGNNPRIGMVYRNLDKMDEGTRTAILDHADTLLESLDSL